jgi:hypothetical protein
MLRSGRPSHAAALGVALFTLAFFEPLPLVTGLLFALLAVRAVSIGQIPLTRLLVLAAVAAVSCVAAYGAVRLASGFDLVSAFSRIGEHALRFNEDVDRPYSIWLWANLREFFFGVGACQAFLFAAALADGFPRGASWRAALARPIVVVCAGAAAVLLALDVIGINRGEVIRLWVFLACLFQIPAAYVCARLESRAAVILVVAVALLQGAIGTATIGFILP